MNQPDTATLPSCPLCGGCSSIFDTNPSVQCVVCGCEVWGETPEDAIAKWSRRMVVKLDPFNITKPGDDVVIDQEAEDGEHTSMYQPWFPS